MPPRTVTGRSKARIKNLLGSLWKGENGEREKMALQNETRLLRLSPWCGLEAERWAGWCTRSAAGAFSFLPAHPFMGLNGTCMALPTPKHFICFWKYVNGTSPLAVGFCLLCCLLTGSHCVSQACLKPMTFELNLPECQDTKCVALTPVLD